VKNDVDMIKIRFLLFFFFMLPLFSLNAQDPLYYRFDNYVVVDGSPNDTLIFDVQVKSNSSNTYITGIGIRINFDTEVFGENAIPVIVEDLEVVQPTGYNLNFPASSSGTNQFASTYNAFPSNPPFSGTFNTVFLSNITTEYQGVARYKMLITGTGNAGIEFDESDMANQQFYVTGSGGTASTAYTPLVFENDLLDFPTSPTTADLIISELADPSDSNADFVELYNAGSENIDFSKDICYLTSYDGSTYQSVQLSGTMAPGDLRVVGGPSFASAYPGKTADHTASFIEDDGDVSYYITLFHPYPGGNFIDQYDGSITSFTSKHAVRPFPETSPSTSFNPSDWIISPATTMDMTPGSHRTTLIWDGSSDDDWRDTANWTPSYVPDPGHNASIPNNIDPTPIVSSGDIMRCHDIFVGSDSDAPSGQLKDPRLE
jgi:hypothetical protein